MARSNVPKFGNWENEDNVPYTVYFEKARKNRGGGKVINPNEPQENPEMFPNADPTPLANPTPDELAGKDAVKTVHEQREPPNKSPARGENMGQRTSNEVNYGGHGQRPARPARPSGGSEQSMDRSPLHPHYQAKVMGTGSRSPGWDGKNNDNSRGDQGRSRLRPAPRGDESPDAGAAVPKFGEWDETDPSAAEQFTGIFDKVRAERNAGGANVPGGTPKHSSHNNRGQHAGKQTRCCFL